MLLSFAWEFEKMSGIHTNLLLTLGPSDIWVLPRRSSKSWASRYKQ
jgi:hypothetical protein